MDTLYPCIPGPAPTAPPLAAGPLRLRPPCLEEASLYASWWQDEETLFGFCCEPRSADQIAAALPELEAEARDAGFWSEYVIDLHDRPIGSAWISRWDPDTGTCDLNVLIGEPEFRRQGTGREAVRLLAAWAFHTLDLERVDLCPRDDHIPAIRCYLRAGARLGDVCHEVVLWRGETVCFRRLSFYRADFFPGECAAEVPGLGSIGVEVTPVVDPSLIPPPSAASA
jgi:RimJ/RimL family protein N-acetyltransferase